MKARWLVVLLAFASLACGKTEGDGQDAGAEICNNFVDDDRDLYADCDDSDCTGSEFCGPPPDCYKQHDCFGGGKTYRHYGSQPMPMCVAPGSCVSPEGSTTIAVTMHTNAYAGFPNCNILSMQYRLVKKVDVHGEPVTCARLAQVAGSKESADADQIERSNLFNLQAYDVAPVQNTVCGEAVGLPFTYVGLGGDFIFWGELWNGQRSTQTQMPMGIRLGWVCLETGEQVDPILASHTHEKNPPAGKITRFISTQMPPPQGLQQP